MMHLKSSVITGKFVKLTKLFEAVICSIFSTMVAGFEAYGTALCGHVASASPIEPDSRSIETKPESAVIREPQTKTFVVVRNRCERKISTQPECQL